MCAHHYFLEMNEVIQPLCKVNIIVHMLKQNHWHIAMHC